jgi:outer membrane protein assembly factor BamB
VVRRSATPFVLPARPDPAAPLREPIWTVDLGAPAWADTLVDRGRVIVGADDGRLHALDAASGRMLWTFQADGAIRARATAAAGDIFVQSDGGFLYRLDGTTGAERWRVRVADSAAARLPISDPKGRYENRASAVTVAGDRLYVGTHEGRLLALAIAGGDRLWEYRAGDSITTTPALANGRVYVGSFDRFVHAVDASSGALAWKYDTGDAVTSDVAVAGDRVVVGSRSYDLEGLEAARGTPIWKKYFWFSWVESSPAVVDGVVYVGSSDAAKVFAVDVASGRTIWDTDVLGSAWGRPAVTGSTVYMATAGVMRYASPHRGIVAALDRRSGRARWWYEMKAPATVPDRATPYGFPGSVASGGGMVYAAALDGRLYAFRE